MSTGKRAVESSDSKTVSVNELTQAVFVQWNNWRDVDPLFRPSFTRIRLSSGATAVFDTDTLEPIYTKLQQIELTSARHQDAVALGNMVVIPNRHTGDIRCIAASDIPNGNSIVNHTWITKMDTGAIQYMTQYPERLDQVVSDLGRHGPLVDTFGTPREQDTSLAHQLTQLNQGLNQDIQEHLEGGATVHNALFEVLSDRVDDVRAVLVPGGENIIEGMRTHLPEYGIQVTISDEMLQRSIDSAHLVNVEFPAIDMVQPNPSGSPASGGNPAPGSSPILNPGPHSGIQIDPPDDFEIPQPNGHDFPDPNRR